MSIAGSYHVRYEDFCRIIPRMGATPVPIAPVPSGSDSETHFKNLLDYFKHLVWLTTGAVGIIVAVASYFLFSNLRDVRQDAKEQATRVATDEAKTAVKNAFDEKNINDLILKAAKEKVGTVSDKIIEEQLNSKLRPIEDRMVLIGRISEGEARIHMGSRSALVEIINIVNTTHDSATLNFARSTLVTTSEGYDAFWQADRKRFQGKPLDYLAMHIAGRPQNLHDVVAAIEIDQDLNAVAVGFIVFREITGEMVKMFDFAAVKSWCTKNQDRCR